MYPPSLLSGLAGAPEFAAPLTGSADARVRRTIAAMQHVVSESLRDPDIVDRAAQLVQSVDGRDRSGQIRELRRWLESHVRFLPDPLINGDVIRTPALLLAQLDRDGFMQGDCDDVATLAATMAHAVGLAARFVLCGFGGDSSPFQHVYAELLDESGGWHDMDVTETDERKRQTPPTRIETHDAVPGIGSGLDMRGLMGLFQGAVLAVQAATAIRDLLEEAGIEL